MIYVGLDTNSLVVSSDADDLAGRHHSQLEFWGFAFKPTSGHFVCRSSDLDTIAAKVISYLDRRSLPYCLDATVAALLAKQQDAARSLQSARARGKRLKDGALDGDDLADFRSFLEVGLARPLKDHQYKAAFHLLSTSNGANFSVPGSGKTSVVLAVFHYLRQMGKVDALFVVGPPACFGPWRHEYREVLGAEPTCAVMAGGDVIARRSMYLVNTDSACDLYLTTYQTLQRDWEQVRVLFAQQGIRFFLIVDEAHYIKQADGAWASAVLNVARHAARRCVLTGTPFPRSYSDGFNLFDVLWPGNSPIPSESRHRIQLYTQQNQLESAGELLEATIGPLFYRVRKVDLHLAAQVFHPPVLVAMNRYERLVYDSILDRIRHASQSDYLRNLDLLVRLRRGRMIRLRQCVSYTRLLAAAVTECDEDLVGGDLSLSQVLRHYDELERPGKIEALLPLVQSLVLEGEKVVIWANFVRTLEYLRDAVAACGIGVQLIYGATPTESATVDEELSREEIIRQFVDREGGISVLVANPAACAESISLHRTCSHAVYYDLSYNCAQYIQSLDRIHRVGGSELKQSHYHFLQYSDSLEGDILANVQRKAEAMSAVVDRDYPIYSLDMFGEEDELSAYERLFGDQQKPV